MLLLLLSRFSHIQLWATPSLGSGGFSRQEHWSGLPFPSPMNESEVAQSRPTRSDPMDCSPPGSPRPWDSQGKNTGVGCHFLLQCMKVKSESEVAQSCPTLSNAMDHSLPGSSVHGIFQERVLEWLAIAFSVASLPHSNLKKQSSASYPKPSTTMPLNLSFRNFLLPCV